MTLFLRALYVVMHFYFQTVMRLETASKTFRTDWAELSAAVKVWAVPNPHSSLVYRGRHNPRSRCRCGKASCTGRRQMRTSIQEADVRRILRGLEYAGAALTGEIRRVSA